MAYDFGSVEWFRWNKRQILDHARAGLSFAHALQSAEALVTGWADLVPIVRSSLHTSIVVSYARPFKKNKAKDGSQRTYSVGYVDSGADFSKDVHDHLIEIRDRLVAHSD